MKTVMLFGDSNTHGMPPMATLDDGGRYGREERWARRLAALLPGWDVIEEGQSGRTTVHDDPIEGAHKNGLRALPILLETHQPLDLVVIMLGTNDLKPRLCVGAQDIALSLEKLVEVVRASGCGPDGRAPQVLVVAPPPIREVGPLAEMFAGGAAKSLLLADRIGTMAARVGVAFLDAGAHVQVSPIDGIHYGPEANPALAQAIAAAIRANFA